MSQQYDADINVRTPSGDLVTVYHDIVAPPGLSIAQFRAAAEKAALAEIPGGTVVGSRVSTDGRWS